LYKVQSKFQFMNLKVNFISIRLAANLIFQKARIKFYFHKESVNFLTIKHKKLFKVPQKKLSIAFRATNNSFSHLRNKAPEDVKKTIGISRMKCNTCDYLYIIPTSKSLGIRCREHVRY
jgi:hypothetical protein